MAAAMLHNRWRYVRKTLAACLPEKSEAEWLTIRREMYQHLGEVGVECLRLPCLTQEQVRTWVIWPDENCIPDALARGCGLLLLSGHLGNWELAGASIPLHFGFPPHPVVKSFRHKMFDAYWRAAREKWDVQALPAHNSYRQCMRILKNNGVICMIIDQNMIRKEGIFVDFFGRPACTTPGLAYLSAQSGAPVVPIFSFRETPERHLVDVYPLIDPPPDREPETIQAYTQQYTAVTEQAIRRHPAQWIWIHKRWKTQPEP